MDVIGRDVFSMVSPCWNAHIPGLHSLILQQNWAKNYPEMNGVVAQHWTIIPGGIPPDSYEPIIGIERFYVFGIEIYSSTDWNVSIGVNLPITLML